MRRILTLAVVAAAFILTPFALRADSITETFSLAIPTTTISATGAVKFSTTPFAEFNPANGTLNSTTVTLAGPLTWTISSRFGQPLDATLLFHNTNYVVGTGFAGPFFTPGAIALNLSTDSIPTDLPYETGTGTTVFDLQFFGDAGDTIATTSPGGLAGTITYNYTPAAPTPAPESSTMLQLIPTLLGTLAFGWWLEQRKRRASCEV